MTTSLIEHFSSLEDPRIERNRKQELMDIIVLTISAVCSGADGWEAIEDFGRTKLEWLRQYVPLANGVPSHDCIAYVLKRLSVDGFRQCFINWTEAAKAQTGEVSIAIDGKTARGSGGHGSHPLHMVSAWACENRLVLAQQVTDEKSNEITAIPKLLKLLELNGCIVSIDAMGCQHEIASDIIDQKGHYVLALKGNQKDLYDAVEDYFTVAQQHDFKHISHDYTVQLDKDHGRLELRRYWISDDLSTLPKVDQWKGLCSIGMVEREIVGDDQSAPEQRFFICSITPDAKLFAKAVRGHWGVENPLHWRLDVVLGDDACRIRTGNGPAIMTSIRHLCLNLFEREPSKLSLTKKRRKAAWDDQFRANVLFA